MNFKYLYLCVYIYLCVHIYMHIYMYTYTHLSHILGVQRNEFLQINATGKHHLDQIVHFQLLKDTHTPAPSVPCPQDSPSA